MKLQRSSSKELQEAEAGQAHSYRCGEAQGGPAPWGLTPHGSPRNSRAVPSHQPSQVSL